MDETNSDSASASVSGSRRPRVWRTRLLWLVGLWTASVLVAMSVVEIVRLGMDAAGMPTH
ncbi:MAG TPA: DUF2474 domain-containing protein [Paraburkholderia sp.]|jgi:hypothetical protein|nr:DUF2474 domain-containing protein [Paraburkholderia sp.]